MIVYGPEAKVSVSRGVPFFWMPQQSVPASTYYVMMDADLAAAYVATNPLSWDVSLPLEEMLA